MLSLLKHFELLSFLLGILVFPVVVIFSNIVVRYVKETTSYVLEGILYFVGRTIKHSFAANITMRRYCRMQLGNERVKYLHVPSSKDINLEIDKIFVRLTLIYNQSTKGDLTDESFLAVGNRIKIMGDPGSGKSSLIKRTFRSQCREGFYKPGSTKLPILIELKNIIIPDKIQDEELGEWFFNYIRKDLAKIHVYKMQECLDNYAVTRGILVMLDGLDEVSSANYLKMEKAINGLSVNLGEMSENNVIVLTMRTQYYQQVKANYLANFPHAAFLKPFSPADIYEFLSRWPFSKDVEANISRIYGDLTDRPTLREMCRNPLILSMYVAEDQISGGNISPESRTEFYKKVTEELIIKRRLKQKTRHTLSPTVLRDHRERILGRIAYDHITDAEEPRNTIQWTNAISVIRQVLKCDAEAAAIVFDEIASETGLIMEERNRETFRFIHLTFCEFLAAFEAVQGLEKGWEKLISKHRTFVSKGDEDGTRLLEVIPFTTGLLPKVGKANAIEDVAGFDDYNLMLRCYLETKLYSHPGWEGFIKRTSQKLLEKANRKLDEQWLQDLHVFNVVVRDAQLNARYDSVTNIDLSNFYEDLLKRHSNVFDQILSAYAGQDAAAAFRLCEICHIRLIDFPEIVIRNSDQVLFLGLIRERVINQVEDCEKWAVMLVESALEKRLVAKLLHETPASDILRSRMRKDRAYRQWYWKGYLDETFYTQCIGLSSKLSREGFGVRALFLLLQLRSPYENRYRYILVKYTYFLFLILIFPFLVFRDFRILRSTPLHWLSTTYWMAFSYFGISVFFSLYQSLKFSIGVAVNLRSPSSLKARIFNADIYEVFHSNWAMRKRSKSIIKALLLLRK